MMHHTHIWFLTLLFIADPCANTCCNIELIFDSSLDFTTLKLNLAHPASKKGRAVPVDKHWFDPLGLSGQWLVCDFFLFLLLPCQQCPKLKGPVLCGSLSHSTCTEREGLQGHMLSPWGDPAGGGEGSDYIHKHLYQHTRAQCMAPPSVWQQHSCLLKPCHPARRWVLWCGENWV